MRALLTAATMPLRLLRARAGRKITGAALLLVALVWLTAKTLPAADQAPAAQAPSPSPSASSSLHEEEGHEGEHEHGVIAEPTAPPPASDATRIAEGFARAWIRGDLDASTWHAGVAAWCDPVYARQLETVDPARVPARAITGPAVLTPAAGAFQPVDVPTDTGVLTITVAPIDGQTKVTRTTWTPK